MQTFSHLQCALYRAAERNVSFLEEMSVFILTLKAFAPIFIVVGVLHLALGAGADVLLGAILSEQTLRDPVLDSQNRFYGVSFTLYGVLLFLSATDLEKYRTVLRCVLWVFFFAGLARVVSIATHGIPSSLILALLCSELLVPPVLLIWQSRIERES